MSESHMPAAEVNSTTERELQSYEFAFHILPTVAEGEVLGVFDALKAHITKLGGTVTTEEAPERFDLAYEIVKYLEGKNRKFSSAYFGWVRFELEAQALATLTEEIDGVKEILRYLMIKLTKVEEAHAFRFHESIDRKKVYTIAEEEVAVEEEIVVDTVVVDEGAEVVVVGEAALGEEEKPAV